MIAARVGEMIRARLASLFAKLAGRDAFDAAENFAHLDRVTEARLDRQAFDRLIRFDQQTFDVVHSQSRNLVGDRTTEHRAKSAF